MKKILIIVILSIAFNTCFAQYAVINSIKRTIVVDKSIFYTKKFEKKSFLFSLALSIDENGKVDTVINSDSEIFETGLVNVKEIITSLKRDAKSFILYKNQVLFIGINVKRDDDDMYSAMKGLDKIYQSLLKTTEIIGKDKKITYLDTLLIVI